MSLQIAVNKTWDGQPVAADAQVALRVQWCGDVLEIRVDAPYYADTVPSGAPGPTDGLWGYEVVELFLVGSPGAHCPYTEIELGPHGHHLVLQLEGVRNPVQTCLPIDYVATTEGARWLGIARVPAALLPNIATYNAYAISGERDARRYLAAHAVPGPAPDFHRLGFFADWPLGVKPVP